MTQAITDSIGGLVGSVCKVDKAGSRDCIKRFLRVKIRFNVRESFMRWTFVRFPDDGKVWVDFRYEALPKYCLICGMLGHATRTCKDLQAGGKGEGESSGEMDEAFSFRRLDVVMDLRGNPLGTGSRSRTSLGSSGGCRRTAV